MKIHFFQKALELAEQAQGKTGINPNVGAVIVKNGRIVGSGHTQECGKNHAEVEALAQAGENAKGADLYVTLEPCCHHGRTPPCTEKIIAAGIKRVFAGISDPNPLVGGRGFQQLKRAGIELTSGIEEEKVRQQLEIYLTNCREKRPFFIMKNAVSLDGRIACSSGKSKWITCTESRTAAHRLRQSGGVILTGINTVLEDDPLMNVRLAANDNLCQPKLRVVLDSSLRIPVDCQIAATAEQIPVLVIKSADYENTEKEKILAAKGVEVFSVDRDSQGMLSLTQVVSLLNKKEIPSVLIEAGAGINTSFWQQRLVDKLYYCIAPIILGGDRAVTGELGFAEPAAGIRIAVEQINRCGEDIMIIGYPLYPDQERDKGFRV